MMAKRIAKVIADPSNIALLAAGPIITAATTAATTAAAPNRKYWTVSLSISLFLFILFFFNFVFFLPTLFRVFGFPRTM